MRPFDQDKVSEHFSILPGNIQDGILDQKPANALRDAMEGAGLTPGQVKQCNQQATLVVVGFATEREFRQAVIDGLGIERSRAEQLVADIEERVFMPYFTKLLSEVAPPVRKVLEEGMHTTATQRALEAYRLDDEAHAAIEGLVRMVLLGLQTRDEFHNMLTNHQSLTREQGEEVMIVLDKALFAPLAEHLTKRTAADSAFEVPTLTSFLDDERSAQERLVKLPGSVQEVIRSTALNSAFHALVQKHDLGAARAKILGRHVVTVLVGLGTTNDFKVNVTRDTGLDPSALDALFQDVEQLLFKPVRTAILAALEEKKAAADTQQPAAGTADETSSK